MMAQNLTAKLKSQKKSYNMHMQGGSQMMWAKDRTYNKEGFIQEGALGNVSFYYSLPRLIVSGNITYMDESGNSKTVEVAGQGWVDRQVTSRHLLGNGLLFASTMVHALTCITLMDCIRLEHIKRLMVQPNGLTTLQ
jgi:predicted secreted hydrolase